MDSHENYVYKTEVNWSLLTEGLTLPVENQVIFARNMGKFLHRGEVKPITLYLNGKGYRAQVILLFSGGIDSTVLLFWLLARRGFSTFHKLWSKKLWW